MTGEYFNLTNVSNSVSLSDLLVSFNGLTGNMLGLIILIVVYLTLLLFFSAQRSPTSAFMASSFITTILAFLLYVLGVVSLVPIGILLVLTAMGMLASFRSD